MLTNDLVAQYLGECHLRGLARSTTELSRAERKHATGAE